MKHYVSSPTRKKAKPQEPTVDLPPWETTSVVGTRVPRIDGYERVTGSATYTMDVTLPGMIHAVIVRCPHAHARVLSVDTSRAEALPGVSGIVTAATSGASIPWYSGGNGPTSVLFDEHCRYAGEEVAAIAADTLLQAYDAANAVGVEYEVLPFVSSAREALETNAPFIHSGSNLQEDPWTYERGDVEAGFNEADVILEENFSTACQIHTPLETFVTVAKWDGDRLTVWVSTQGVFGLQQPLADAFGLPLSSVHVSCKYMGGGFGSKLALGKHTVIASLLARQTGKPVKLALSREETFLCEGNRPANEIRLKVGAKSDGTLTALDGSFLGTVGAYPSGATSPYLALALYQCENARVQATDVYSNAGVARAMRAPGFPQCAWALEQMIDALAHEIGMDPVEFRMRNEATTLQSRGNMPYTSNGLHRCLSEGAREFGWSESRVSSDSDNHLRKGVGVAAGMWGWPGDTGTTVFVKLLSDGSVNLNMGAADIGTGTKTVMAMIVSEELGLPLEKIQVEHADTATTQFSPASGGSQTVVITAPAVRLAAVEAKRQLLDIAAGELDLPANELAVENGIVGPIGDVGAGLHIEELDGLQIRHSIVGVGHRPPFSTDRIALPFAAQFVEVEVNMRTGAIKLIRMLAAHDSGRVMNRFTYDNQVFGGFTMGIGFGMTEARIIDGRQTGKVLNANWHSYKIPTMMDFPNDSTCYPIDPGDVECNNVGAKGLGEPATLPTAAAIANAVFNATGIRVLNAPITPMEMLRLIREQREEG